MEIAFISSNKLRLELEKKQNLKSSHIISIFTKNPQKFIATMLIGNTISLILYGMYTAKIIEPLISLYTHSYIAIITIQTIIGTLIILVTAEFIPKTIFRINPNFSLNFFAYPVLIFYILFYPISKFAINLSHFLLKKGFKINVLQNQNIVFSKIDIDNFVKEFKNKLEKDSEYEHDIKIFQNALDFSKVKLRECIVPRTEIIALEINDTIENLKDKFVETGFSKILIYKNSIDNIIGYVHSSELFKSPHSIKNILRDLLIVPENMPANKLLASFIQQNKNIAVVVDEFGGTSGMVTIEDIIEEIFGEIEDEHDTINFEERIISESEYILSGRLEIDYLNEKYNLFIPKSADYETIAGYILFHYESIPKLNETITIDRFQIKILKASYTRIELINLKFLNKD